MNADDVHKLRSRLVYYLAESRRDQQRITLSVSTLRSLLVIEDDIEPVVSSIAAQLDESDRWSARWNESALILTPVVEDSDAVTLRLFEQWKVWSGQSKAMLTDARKAMVRQRLKEGATEEELRRALWAMTHNPFNLGDNDNGQKYLKFELVMRRREQVEKYLKIADRLERSKSPKQGDIKARFAKLHGG
jgi:hypothetical protein